MVVVVMFEKEKKEEQTMVYIWRRLRGRCTSCGQAINTRKSPSERVLQINDRANRLTAELGRRPLTQTCPRCHQIVFEGEPGFVQRYLLVDIV